MGATFFPSVTNVMRTAISGRLLWIFQVMRVLLLDVVQATRVWFQDGRVMEHLVESDAQEDHIELRDKQIW